jgi:hypothetical protein
MPNLNYTDYVERFGNHNLEVITTESEYTAAITELKRLKKNHCQFKFTVKGPCCGVEFQTTWGIFDNKKVKNCSACNYKAFGKCLRDSYADVKKKFEDLGVTLLTTEDEYNADTLGLSRFEFKIIAKCGHERETKFFNFEGEAINHGICKPCCAKMKYTKVNLSSKYVNELFTKAGCEILSSYEKNIFKNITYKAACGHTSTEIMNDIPFKDKKKINCNTCRYEEAAMIRNNLVNKDGQLNVLIVENEALKWIRELIEDKFEMIVTDEGCRADFIIKPKEIEEDVWAPVQLKSAEASIGIDMKNFRFALNNDYTGMIMLFTAKIIDAMWIIDYDVIKNNVGINTHLYQNTKYFKYAVPPCYLYQKMYDLYNSDIISKNTIEHYMKREFKSIIHEDKYRLLRKTNLPFLNFEETPNYSVTDFKINNYNIQEKIAVKSCNLYTLNLHKSYGRSNKIAYEKGDNDFYWIHLEDWRYFFIIPENILLQYGFITDENKIGKKYLGISLNGKQNSWILEYKYDYENLDIDNIKSLFESNNNLNDQIINLVENNIFIAPNESYESVISDILKLEYKCKTTKDEFEEAKTNYKYLNEIPLKIETLCGHNIVASLFTLKCKINSMCAECETKDFDSLYDSIKSKFENLGVVLKMSRSEVIRNKLSLRNNKFTIMIPACSHIREINYYDLASYDDRNKNCLICFKKNTHFTFLKYEDIVTRFQNIQCSLITTKEQFNENKMTIRSSFKIIATCGHEKIVIPSNITFARKSPLVCDNC